MWLANPKPVTALEARRYRRRRSHPRCPRIGTPAPRSLASWRRSPAELDDPPRGFSRHDRKESSKRERLEESARDVESVDTVSGLELTINVRTTSREARVPQAAVAELEPWRSDGAGHRISRSHGIVEAGRFVLIQEDRVGLADGTRRPGVDRL